MDGQIIIDAVTAVTKKWAKQRKAEERDRSAYARRQAVMTQSCRTTDKEAAYEVMKAAYLKASSDGRYPAKARQIMYAARGPIQARTGKQLKDQYFCQTLLPNYMIENPSETATWDVVFDARGHFEEPHTQLNVPLGTLDVRAYLASIQAHQIGDPKINPKINIEELHFPTRGARHRFGAVLFVEKEGFSALFKATRLAERYDLASLSTKGMSVTASRSLVDHLCSEGIPLLVLRDFDKSGFSIVGTFRRDTRRYQFTNDIEVIDLGLRLDDIEACALESEDVYYGKANPVSNLVENGANEEEIEFLCSGRNYTHGYHGRRVELNAFASGDLIAWVEGKLQRLGVKKVIPDRDTLEIACRRTIFLKLLNNKIPGLMEEVQADVDVAKVPKSLEKQVRKRLKEEPALAWDKAVAELAAKEIDRHEEE